MNCQEFSKRIDEHVGVYDPQSASDDMFHEHAANCVQCGARLESERALTAGLQMVAADERKIEAPSFLRAGLLVAFESHARPAGAKVVPFPSRASWAKWALAAAATILIGFVLFSTRWAPKPEVNVVAGINAPSDKAGPGEAGSKSASNALPPNKSDEKIADASSDKIESPRKARRTSRAIKSTRTDNNAPDVASAEVMSAFVPLTYLNNATAMDNGIVVRVEIAREQLATLGLPYDLERADEIIKADIVVGDDGVARAIRLVQ